MSQHLQLDTAQWSPALVAAAQASGARSIAFYALDADIPDQDGWCGGWTPQRVQAIRSAGLTARPIFGFRPASGLPSYERCLQILQLLGCGRGSWVYTDREADLVPTVDFQVGFNRYLGEQGYASAPYGAASTLNDGCLAYAQGVWLANWGQSPPWSPPPQLGAIPAFGDWSTRSWQYSHDQEIAGVSVDVSVSNLPLDQGPQQEEQDMIIVNGPDGVGYAWNGPVLVPLPDLAGADAFTAVGVPWSHQDQPTMDAIKAAIAAHEDRIAAKLAGTLSVTLTGSGQLTVG